MTNKLLWTAGIGAALLTADTLGPNNKLDAFGLIDRASITTPNQASTSTSTTPNTASRFSGLVRDALDTNEGKSHTGQVSLRHDAANNTFTDIMIEMSDQMVQFDPTNLRTGDSFEIEGNTVSVGVKSPTGKRVIGIFNLPNDIWTNPNTTMIQRVTFVSQTPNEVILHRTPDTIHQQGRSISTP